MPFSWVLTVPFFHAEASGRREGTTGGYNSGVAFPFMEQVCSGNVSFLSSGGSCCTVSDIHPHVSCIGHPECFRIFSSFGLAVSILRLIFFLQVYLKTKHFCKIVPRVSCYLQTCCPLVAGDFVTQGYGRSGGVPVFCGGSISEYN